jgi:hypothetical protein
MAEKKAELVKNVLINLGILLILVSSTAAKDTGTSFFLGLILLALHTFDWKSIEPRKLIVSEIILASSLAFATLIQLILSKSFSTPQVFMIILLLGSILVSIEAVRKYADL